MEETLLQNGQTFRFVEAQESVYMTNPLDGGGMGYQVPACDARRMYRAELLHETEIISTEDELWVESAYWSICDIYCVRSRRLRDGIRVHFAQSTKPTCVGSHTCLKVILIESEPRKQIVIDGRTFFT